MADMQLIPQPVFDVFALALPRGHGFGDRPPVGAWGDDARRVCGVVTQHIDDGSLGLLAMRRRVDDVWVVIAEEFGFASLDDAKARLESLLRLGEPPEPLQPNTASRPALHDLGNRTASDIFKVLQLPSHHRAAWVLNQLYLALPNPDLTTARRIQDAINRMLGDGAAIATNPATVELVLPSRGAGDIVALLTDIEQLRVDPDQVAKVVIDEKTGIIVMGSEVRVSEVAIAQGNLTIKISETPQVSQPQPFSENGDTVVVPRSDVQVDTGGDKKLAIVRESVSLRALVDGLNALGIGPRDMISILQAIKAAGALQAEIEVM